GRTLHAPDRSDVHEDRRTQAQLLGTRAERNVHLDPALIVSPAAECVVDQIVPVLEVRIEDRIRRVGQIDVGKADDARTDTADVEPAHLRFAELEAIDETNLVARRRRAAAERIDITALRRHVQDEAVAEIEMLAALDSGAGIFDAAAE